MSTKICSIEEIASWKKRDIGFSEENVKVKVVVPLLLALGHRITQLDFEHYGIDIFLKDLPAECQTFVETKSLGQSFEGHIPQLQKYVARMKALFAVICNGEEIRVYALPYDVPICSIQRKELAEPAKFELLRKFLSRKNLATKKCLVYLHEEVLRIEEMQIQKYKDLTDISQVLTKQRERFDDETKRLISRAEKLGLLPVLDKINEAMAHNKNLSKLHDKLRKLGTR